MFRVPFDLEEAFGRARPPVKVTIRGHTWRTTPGVYDGIGHVVVNRAVKAATGVDAPERVRVDDGARHGAEDGERPGGPPRSARCRRGRQKAFSKLSYTHRREYVDWVEEAKRPETRTRRIAATVERVAKAAAALMPPLAGAIAAARRRCATAARGSTRTRSPVRGLPRRCGPRRRARVRDERRGGAAHPRRAPTRARALARGASPGACSSRPTAVPRRRGHRRARRARGRGRRGRGRGDRPAVLQARRRAPSERTSSPPPRPARRFRSTSTSSPRPPGTRSTRRCSRACARRPTTSSG